MKAIIIYASTYKGNTKKIAKAMAEALPARLASVEEARHINLTEYDLIGLGSGINFAQHHAQLLNFVKQHHLEGADTFIFSTRCRPFLGSYHKALKKLLHTSHANILGEFSCAGFDRTGPWVGMNGYNKSRPNEKDLFKAQLFANKMRWKAHPLSNCKHQPFTTTFMELPAREINKNLIIGKTVLLNSTTCIACKKCLQECPLHVFELQQSDQTYILPMNGQNCIQCRKCAENCPTNSLYINESFANGLRIAIREMTSNKLQNAYRNAPVNH